MAWCGSLNENFWSGLSYSCNHHEISLFNVGSYKLLIVSSVVWLFSNELCLMTHYFLFISRMSQCESDKEVDNVFKSLSESQKACKFYLLYFYLIYVYTLACKTFVPTT